MLVPTCASGGVKHNRLFMATRSTRSMSTHRGGVLPDPRSPLNFRRKAPTARPPAGLLGFLRRRPFWHMLIDTAQRPVGELAEIIIQRQDAAAAACSSPSPMARSVVACSRDAARSSAARSFRLRNQKRRDRPWSGAIANCRYSFWAALTMSWWIRFRSWP